jgi:hypothetical protein
MEAKKQYHKEYYNKKYKETLKSKKSYCDICAKEINSWSIYKHNQSKQHTLRCMDENEYKKYLAEKINQKLLNFQHSIKKIHEQLIS